jgi:hypothetical protein
MRKTFITLPAQLIAVVLCFCCLPVAAQKGRGAQPKPPEKKSSAGGIVPDEGRVAGATYTNGFFGLSLTIPEGWRVADKAIAQQIDRQGADLVAGDSAEKRARLREAASKNINLITMGKLIPVGDMSESALLIVGAEAVPTWLVKTPQEYVSHARRLLQSSAMPVKVEPGTRSETIGGVEFVVLDVSSEQPGGLVKQHYYATLKKGYALFFITTFAGERSAQAITEVLKSVTFK